jgi:5-methylcytosine-specific restriction protein A
MAESGRNPDWSRDELILALDLYMRNRQRLPDADSKEVAELSDLLNRLGAAVAHKQQNFRNTNGVYMKLGNFRAVDPAYTSQGKKGLNRGSKADVQVWSELAGDMSRLHTVADAIRTAANSGEITNLPPVPDEAYFDAPEGRILTRMHIARERNAKLVKKKKDAAYKQHGAIRCDACDFNFAAVYGERGSGYIEAHHLKPVYALAPGTRTSLGDLALLCANCHRMIHARQPWLTLDALRGIISHG